VTTRAELAARLRALSAEMVEIAVEMDYFGGLAPWARHGLELAGAAGIAREWAEEIEAEAGQEAAE
jgi:hypothetical protein